MRRRQASFAGAAAIALALAAVQMPVAARTSGLRFYVAPTGSDVDPGTAARPWRTIQKALDKLKPGETAYVREGTYSRPSSFDRSGTASRRITLRNYPGERPLVTARLRIRGSYLTVRGLHFRGQTAANPDAHLIYVYGGDSLVIEHNELEGGYKSAIYVGEPDDLAYDLRLIGNYIHDNGKAPERVNRAHGLYCGHCRGGVVANNLFDHNLAWNIQLYPDARDMVVMGNTIVNAGASGIVVGGDEQLASRGIRIVNNIFAFNRHWGIQMYEEGGPRPARVTSLRNLFYRNGEGAVRRPFGGIEVARSLFSSPGFRGPGDYRLGVHSAAVDRALPPWVMGFDFAGRRRPQGRGYDLGAFER